MMTSTISYATRRTRPLATLPLLAAKKNVRGMKPRVRTSLTIAAKGAMFRLTLGPSPRDEALRLV